MSVHDTNPGDDSFIKSMAHERSAQFILDPAYKYDELYSHKKNKRGVEVKNNSFATCFYHPVNLEHFRLSRMVENSKAAGLNVYYPTHFLSQTDSCKSALYFRPKKWSAENVSNKTIRICSNGTMEIRFDGNERVILAQANQWISLPLNERLDEVKVTMTQRQESCGVNKISEPPCLVCNDHYLRWECSFDVGIQNPSWTIVTAEDMKKEYLYPHSSQEDDEMIEKIIFPKQINNTKNVQKTVYDFEVQLLGRIVIETICHGEKNKNKIHVTVGESMDEMNNDCFEHSEQQSQFTLRDIQENGEYDSWESNHILAFRYVRIVNEPDIEIKSVKCRALFHPVSYKGAFASCDKILTKIWLISAYTLRLCLFQGIIVDGIKRDRLPWAGDLAVSILVNAYTFADVGVVQRTLLALDQISLSSENDIIHVNGIVDYSLWWIISHDLYQIYFKDSSFLKKVWPRIGNALTYLLKKSKDDMDSRNGFLKWDNSFYTGKDEKSQDWVFIDWGLDNMIEKFTSIQIMWWWALKSGIALAKRQKEFKIKKNDELLSFINQCRQKKIKVQQLLFKHCWDEKESLWLSHPNYLQNENSYSLHACILSIVSGLNKSFEKKDYKFETSKIYNALTNPQLFKMTLGTPFFKYLKCLALHYIGKPSLALKETRKYWKTMMDYGATTFWEALDVRNSKDYSKNWSMYNRLYGKSLCHSWSSGPCHLFPQIIFGVRPLNDGWSKWTCYTSYEVQKILAELELGWASVAIPTPYNENITIDINNTEMNIYVPNTTTLTMGRLSYSGPCKIHLKMSCKGNNQSYSKNWSLPYRNWYYISDYVIPPKPTIVGFEDIIMTDVPTVYQLPGSDQNQWYMSFIGYDTKGYQSFVAESKDLLTWTNFRLAFSYGEAGDFDYGGRVLGGYLYDDYGIKSRRVLKRVNGKFWCLYGCYAKQGSYEIDPGYEGVATSVDGLIWHRAKSEPILSVYDKSAGMWEKGCIYQPWLIEINGYYLNLYNAKSAPPEWIEQIGLATSNNLLDWKRYSGSPVLRNKPNSYHDHFAAGGKVYWDDSIGQWTMLFFGVDKTNHAHIMIAFSHDLYHWVVDDEPLYKAGGHPCGLDKEHAHKVSLIWNHIRNCWFMFYDAVGEKGRGIALLTSKPLA